MMTEQAESFAQNDDDDVGCIFFFFFCGMYRGTAIDLQLSDTSPVQTTYTSITRPMYAEVKALR